MPRVVRRYLYRHKVLVIHFILHQREAANITFNRLRDIYIYIYIYSHQRWWIHCIQTKPSTMPCKIRMRHHVWDPRRYERVSVVFRWPPNRWVTLPICLHGAWQSPDVNVSASAIWCTLHSFFRHISVSAQLFDIYYYDDRKMREQTLFVWAMYGPARYLVITVSLN